MEIGELGEIELALLPRNRVFAIMPTGLLEEHLVGVLVAGGCRL